MEIFIYICQEIVLDLKNKSQYQQNKNNPHPEIGDTKCEQNNENNK